MTAPPIRAMPRRITPARVRRSIELALIALVAVQGVRFAYALITPVTPLGDWQPATPTALSRDARAALFARFDPFYRQAAVDPGAAMAVTALPLTLFGVRTDAATGGGSAIIAGADGVQTSIGTGEAIQPGVRLVGVAFDHVIIERAGTRELLYLDQDDAVAAAGGTPLAPNLSSASAPPAAALSAPVLPPPAPINPASIRAGIGFAPRSIDGRISGIAVAAQGDGSAFAAVGFRPGDVIRSVNGQPIRSAADLAALSSRLQPGARLSLEVERGAGTAQVALLIPNGNP